MKYDNLSKEELLEKIIDFEAQLKTYVDNVDRRYKVFFERNLAGIYRTKLNGEILDCNDAMAQIMGYDTKEELIGGNAKMLYKNLSDRKEHLEFLKKNKFIKNRKLQLIKKDGSLIWVSISTSEIREFASQKTEYMEGTMIDITELIKTQEMLITSEENYKKMLNESPYGILIHDKGKILYRNKRAEEILEVNLKDTVSISSIFPEKFIRFNFKKKGSIEHFDRVAINSSKKMIHIDLYLKQVLFENKPMTEFSFVNVQDRIELEEEKIKSYVFKNLNDKLKQEIKEKERVEKELMTSLNTNIKQSAKLEAIFENSSHMMWTVDEKLRLTSFNNNLSNLFLKLYGVRPQKIDKPIIEYENRNSKDKKQWKEAYMRVFNGESINFISEAKDAGGNFVFLNVFINPIKDKKRITEVSVIAHDITDKVIAELKLTESLKEKEVLIKEIHHRVKNNLQVISSIFNLQSAFTEEERIKEVLKESQNRIKSMAYIHESLYKSSELGKIDFEHYVQELCKNLIHSYTYKENDISLLTETESVILDLDLAIPCGLIVNEIISNSLKHAFNEGSKGIIAVFLKKKNGVVKLVLKDDGIGIAESSFEGESNSLGVQLIQTLVEQIKGKINVDGTQGTTIEITFPLN